MQEIFSGLLALFHFSKSLDLSLWVKALAPYIFLAAKEPVVVAVIVFGFWLISQKIFSRSLVVICFTLVISFFLKCLWKAPLPPGVGADTWAFPSGHMLWASVFWGYLAWSQPRAWVRVIVLAFLAFYGWAIVAVGYHYPQDIWGAAGFAIVIVSGIFRLERSERVRRYPQAFVGSLWLVSALAFCGTLWLAGLRPATAAGLAGLTVLMMCEMMGWIPGSLGLPLRWRALGCLVSFAGAAGMMFYVVPLLQRMTSRPLADSAGFVVMIVLSTVMVPKLITQLNSKFIRRSVKIV